MLNIITGRTGSGKTRYIRISAAEIAEKESGKTVIIVPEQFSFETERGMLELLGNEKINNIEILSFSRFAERLLSDYCKMSKRTVDDGMRAALMSIAIETLEDKLTVFSRYRRHPALIGELLSFYREMKKSCITSEQLLTLSNTVSKDSFKRKLVELSLIFDCYGAVMKQSFGDDCAYLDELYELLGEVDYFSGKTVFIDAFSGFSAQEYNIIERIMKQADDLFITFCCDTEKNNQRYELFYNAAVEIKKLKSIASRSGVKIAPEKRLFCDRKYKAEALNILEENLFSPSHTSFAGGCDGITLAPCRSEADECDAVAAEIKRLIRTENYRYRDIAVIERTSGSYRGALTSSFRKYGIDCFLDSRQPVSAQPLMVFMLALFDILTEGFSTETVLRFLKTGLYGFTVEETALLEDYCLTWNIRQSQWQSEWTGNPDGYGVEFNDDSREKLEMANSLRTRIVAPVISLKSRITDTDGETVSRELFMFLRRIHADESLKELVKTLRENGETDLANEQDRIWKMLVDIFDGLYFAVGKSAVTLTVTESFLRL